MSAALTREAVVARIPDAFRARAEAALRAAEGHTLVYLVAVAEQADTAEQGRTGAGVATWEAILNADPPDCIEEFLRASGWLSDEQAVLWTHATLAPGATVSTVLAYEAQLAADRARLGFVCLKLIEDNGEEPETCECLTHSPDSLGRLRETHGDCAFCDDRANVAERHGYPNKSICGDCASAAVEILNGI